MKPVQPLHLCCPARNRQCSSPPATNARVPHPSRFLRWAECNQPATQRSRRSFCLCLSPPTQRTVISTEAAHGPIVSGAVEKSASLPTPSPSHNPAPAFAARHRTFCDGDGIIQPHSYPSAPASSFRSASPPGSFPAASSPQAPPPCPTHPE